jgi:hypothetical protein
VIAAVRTGADRAEDEIAGHGAPLRCSLRLGPLVPGFRGGGKWIHARLEGDRGHRSRHRGALRPSIASVPSPKRRGEAPEAFAPGELRRGCD